MCVHVCTYVCVHLCAQVRSPMPGHEKATDQHQMPFSITLTLVIETGSPTILEAAISTRLAGHQALGASLFPYSDAIDARHHPVGMLRIWTQVLVFVYQDLSPLCHGSSLRHCVVCLGGWFLFSCAKTNRIAFVGLMFFLSLGDYSYVVKSGAYS